MKGNKRYQNLMAIIFVVCFFFNLPFSQPLYKDGSIVEVFVVLASFFYMIAFPFFYFFENKCRDKV